MNKIFLLVSIIVAMASCTKDIQPSPVGEPVPYKPDATRKWQDIMNDADLTLFNAAWKKSDMQDWVKNSGSAFHTFFMPTNEAFTNAGWTSDKINNATAGSLDTLLAYWVAAGSYAPDNLQSSIRRSLPINMLLQTTIPDRGTPYVFRQYIGNWNDSLMINGEPMAKWTENEAALNGYVYKIKRFPKRPTMTLYEYLSSDPRFSTLLQAINTSLDYYIDDAMYNDPDYTGLLKGSMQGFYPTGRVTLFAPTNAAFAASGFSTDQAMRDRIEASLPIGYPDYDDHWYYQYPMTAMDSILRPHGFSLKGLRDDRDVLFFSRDLLQAPDLFSDYIALAGQQYQTGPVMMETGFQNDKGKLMVRSYYFPGSWEPLSETDILCYNGVIHVVDKALMRQ